MLSIIRSELTKAVTLPSVWMITILLVLVNLFFQAQGFSFNQETIANARPDGMSEIDGRLVDANASLFTNYVAYLFNPGLLLPLLGAVIAGTEFRGGQLGMSILAIPRRVKLVVGKACAVALYVLGFEMLWIVVTKVLLYLTISDWDPGLMWSQDFILADARILLFGVTTTLFTFGVTLITRRTLVGIVVSVLLIMVTMTQIIALISSAADAIMPLSAARNLLLTGSIVSVPLTASALHGATVLIGWAAISCAAALVTMTRRDAR